MLSHFEMFRGIPERTSWTTTGPRSTSWEALGYRIRKREVLARTHWRRHTVGLLCGWSFVGNKQTEVAEVKPSQNLLCASWRLMIFVFF